MSTKECAPVNSRQWWDEYFAEKWQSRGGRDQTAFFMRRIIENLPDAEREYLASHEASVLDWGCAFGEGVAELARAFPRCKATGLDFAPRAIAEARRSFPRHEFIHVPDGAIGRQFDAIFVSHCLEHFDDPLAVVREHLRHCGDFYVLFSPYREVPLDPTHRAQFREECFPQWLQGFMRLEVKIIDGDPRHWPGKMILVVYGSPRYLPRREQCQSQAGERRKWEDYYAAIEANGGDETANGFGDELAERIAELLPDGGRVLEAGCGAGGQSLALARRGGFQVSLMDFSPAALRCAEQLFQRHGAAAELIHEDVFAPGEPRWDLVFNSGVLEHYSFDQQAAFLRGMAGRSRKFVLALVPNRMCYWYWLWRGQLSARGNWPYGKETPMTDLSAVFEAAGLRFLGHWFGGATWSENFIKNLGGIDERTRNEILAIHRSAVIPQRQRAYLVAALGCKGEDVTAPACWTPALNAGNEFTLDQLTSSLADALAAGVGTEHRVRQAQSALAAEQQAHRACREQLERRAAELKWSRDELYLLRNSRGQRMLARAARVRRLLLTAAGHRQLAAGLLRRGKRALAKPPAALHGLARRAFRRLPLSAQYRLRVMAAYAMDWRRGGRSVCASSGVLETPGLVSVVLPVYNHARMLPGAVESVLEQTYRNLELIIVNDGSTDGVEEVLARWAGNPRVRILTQPNLGLPKALSNGFEFARGEFRTWTSADNLMHPDQLRRQVEFLQKHAEAGMVFADYLAIDAAGRPLMDPAFRPHNRRTAGDPEIHLPRDTRNFGKTPDNYIGPCFMYRGWLGRLLGEYAPEQGIEDFDYWLRLSLAARIEHLDGDEPLYSYRVHKESLSGRSKELQIPRRTVKLMEHHRRREEYCARPWTIHADAATRAWLSDKIAAPHRVVAWSGGPVVAPADEKTMLLVEAAGLPAAVRDRSSNTACLAAWFPPDAESADKYRAESRGAADVCFAADEATAARLAMLTPRVFQVPPGAKLVALAAAWANNQAFYESAFSAAERFRPLPRVFQSAGRPIRVLLQADDFTQGGTEQVMLDVARSLREDQFDVSLLILGKQGADVEKLRQEGIEVLTLPAENRRERYRDLLRERRIDVVNAHYSLFGASQVAEEGIPFVETVHNSYVYLSPNGAAAYRAADPHVSAYLCVSQMAAHYADVKIGLPVSKMIIVPNGVDLARLDAVEPDARGKLRRELGLTDKDFMFLNVACFQPLKCQDVLVRAFAEVARRRPEAKLVLVGQKMYMHPRFFEQVQQLVARYGLERAVIFTGLRRDVPRFYAAADAFVLPSLVEGWSLALGEAVAAGLPAVATSVGSAPDLLPRVGGRLVRPPFGDITNLDYSNLSSYYHSEDPKFTADLAAAMEEVCRQRRRPMLSAEFRRTLDSREAFKPYGQLFLWLLQGGHPAAARTWTTCRATALQAVPWAEPAAA
jgi:glycosyltransferase involved in cell wall biosynthesis/2-polyprenyl-3-methyl-5-hydroxy-6-metoxy-1,4-benzoquinol methylase